MKIHWLQHVPFEGLGRLKGWIEKKGYGLMQSRLYSGEALPSIDDFDMLIVMGGPMGIYDEALYPWLAQEKQFIRHCVEHNKVVLGICLGAQLLADALGSKVYPNTMKEIGWYEINRQQGLPEVYHNLLPEKISVLHWHGDTYDIPKGALPLYSSKACANQGFVYKDRMVGLQFHLEIGLPELQVLAENCADELTGGEWIQEKGELLAGAASTGDCQRMLDNLLEFLCSK